MAIVSISPKIETSAGDKTSDGVSFVWNRRRTFAVVVESSADTDGQILDNNQIPRQLDSHPDSTYLRVTGRTVRRTSSVYAEVDIDYETQGLTGNPSDLTHSGPLDKPATISFDAIASDVEIDQDINGDPITMVTTEEFKPRPRVTVYDPVIRITRNVTWVNPGIIADYRGAVNSDSWYGMPPGTLKIVALRADKVIDPDITYWVVTGEIHIRRAAPGSTDARAWWLRILAQGFLVNIPAALSFTDEDEFGIIATKNGRPVTEPVLHEVETGYQITDNEDAEWYEFETVRALPFAALGLL